MPFFNTPTERKSTYIDFEQPTPPSRYEGISLSTASSSKSSVDPFSPGSLTSMSWFRSEDSLYQSRLSSSKEKRSRSPFKSPKKLIEPLYKICDALSRKCSFKRTGSPKPRSQEIDLPKPRMLDFESPEKWVSNNRVGYRKLDLSPLCQMSPLEQKKSTTNSRKLIIKRKSINERFERKKDLRMMEGKIEDMDRMKTIDMYKNSGENVNFFGSVRERPNLLKYTDLVPTTSQRNYPEFTSPIATRPSSFTTSTPIPTRKPDGSIYKKKISLSRHRSDAATLRQEHLPPRILSSPTKILYNSRRISQATTRRNSMRKRQKNALEVTYL